ncbi:sulfotransferase domain-containing protein [Aestuariivirga sp.]|uniref:sulfotransferase domain-containing protein n=1 Tax=Aestuariivirga sp. TaxID=2650926 RepID=UPI0035942D4B
MQLPTVFHLRTGLRHVVSAASSVAMPRDAGVRLERRLRGWEDAKKLPHADGVIVSFGKSGRTWFRVLISRYFAHKHGLAEGSMMEFDEFHRANPKIPVLFFTHDNYLKDYVGHDRKFELYGNSRVVLMVRDPRDTAVSQYFQWKHRIVPRKKVINGYPLEEMDVHSFITGEAAGIPKIIEFMNAWGRDLARFPNLLLVKYEDLKSDTAGQLGRALVFLGQSPTDAELADAAEFSSVENMRKMEQDNAGKFIANARLKPGDASDPSSFKVRRAKVGGWRDYVTAEQADAIDAMVRERLDPVFGYK